MAARNRRMWWKQRAINRSHEQTIRKQERVEKVGEGRLILNVTSLRTRVIYEA